MPAAGQDCWQLLMTADTSPACCTASQLASYQDAGMEIDPDPCSSSAMKLHWPEAQELGVHATGSVLLHECRRMVRSACMHPRSVCQRHPP